MKNKQQLLDDVDEKIAYAYRQIHRGSIDYLEHTEDLKHAVARRDRLVERLCMVVSLQGYDELKSALQGARYLAGEWDCVLRMTRQTKYDTVVAFERAFGREAGPREPTFGAFVWTSREVEDGVIEIYAGLDKPRMRTYCRIELGEV